MTSATIATPTALSTSTSPRTAGFLDTLSSEWSKLISLRSTHITVALGVLLSVATAAIVALAVGGADGDWSKDFSPITTSMAGFPSQWMTASRPYVGVGRATPNQRIISGPGVTRRNAVGSMRRSTSF